MEVVPARRQELLRVASQRMRQAGTIFPTKRATNSVESQRMVAVTQDVGAGLLRRPQQAADDLA